MAANRRKEAKEYAMPTEATATARARPAQTSWVKEATQNMKTPGKPVLLGSQRWNGNRGRPESRGRGCSSPAPVLIHLRVCETKQIAAARRKLHSRINLMVARMKVFMGVPGPGLIP
jgi:hypothetical protein